MNRPKFNNWAGRVQKIKKVIRYCFIHQTYINLLCYFLLSSMLFFIFDEQSSVLFIQLFEGMSFNCQFDRFKKKKNQFNKPFFDVGKNPSKRIKI